ncbi:hypothetical protein [Methyloceanibacter marginalis]|nr:hypothetical protein [Methyloceanibacter marginalis]
MRGPVFVGDGAGEDRAELFVPAHLGVEAVDQKANAVIGQRGAI